MTQFLLKWIYKLSSKKKLTSAAKEDIIAAYKETMGCWCSGSTAVLYK